MPIKILLFALLSFNFQEAVLKLTGASDISELSQSEYEHYEQLSSHPLQINRCSRAALHSCGLLSAYQAESILDYRSRNGDILSAAELSIVDGFNSSLADCLAHFLSFGPSDSRQTGQADIGASGGMAGKMATDGSGRNAINDFNLKWYGKIRADIHASSGNYLLSLGTRTDWSRGLIKADTLAWKKGLAGAEEFAWSASYSGSRWLGNISLGHFNARFGQGLTQWSGLVIDSWASPSALMKRPSGIAPYRGWSAEYAMYGAAVNINLGRFSLSAYTDLGDWARPKPGLFTAEDGSKSASEAAPGKGLFSNAKLSAMSFGGNLSYLHRNGQAGISARYQAGENAGSEDAGNTKEKGSGAAIALSADFQHTLSSGVLLFGEAAWDRAQKLPQAVLGTRYAAGSSDVAARVLAGQYECNISAALSRQFGSYPANSGSPESSGSTSGSTGNSHNLAIGSSLSYYPSAKGQTPAGAFQAKLQGNYSFAIGESITLATRADIRIKRLTPLADSTAKYAASWSRSKYELRQDIKWTKGHFNANIRLDALYGDTFAMLGAVEGGWKGEKTLTLWIQAAVFRIDDWDDRIYLYQHDAPGSFNVPAMYGRGYMTSAYIAVKAGKHVKIYARGAFYSYPWARETDTRKTKSAEARLQLNLDF